MGAADGRGARSPDGEFIDVQLATLSYSATAGWSDDLPRLDSERTLVIAFGAPVSEPTRPPRAHRREDGRGSPRLGGAVPAGA